MFVLFFSSSLSRNAFRRYKYLASYAGDVRRNDSEVVLKIVGSEWESE